MINVPEDEYVSSDGVDWAGVARGIVGTFVTVWAIAVVEGIGLLRYGALAVMSGISGFLAMFVERPLVRGSEVMESTWKTAADSLAIFGPFAFLVATISVVVSMWLLIWGVNRFGS